ncbi:hypothetical protein M3Y97_01163400 [Aphelenchoides bicaudatus]|nr:hypothetical protein M3Y97_01163400 [Aphelenchoides bicaudatus]
MRLGAGRKSNRPQRNQQGYAMGGAEMINPADENGLKAMGLKKKDPPLLHKKFYNSFIDVLQPLDHLTGQ